MNELDLLIKYPLPSFSCFNLLKGPSVMSLVSYFFFFWLMAVVLLNWFWRIVNYYHNLESCRRILCVFFPLVVLFIVFSKKNYVICPAILRICPANFMEVPRNFVKKMLWTPCLNKNIRELTSLVWTSKCCLGCYV